MSISQVATENIRTFFSDERETLLCGDKISVIVTNEVNQQTSSFEILSSGSVADLKTLIQDADGMKYNGSL
jgi:hypothetical protein